MSWFANLGSALTGALSRGLDLVLARLVILKGGISAVELEIQKRVPDLPAPAAAALITHVSQASEAAALVEAEPDKPLEDLERIPVNPLLASRLEPGDRFVYSGDALTFFSAEAPGKSMRVDIASPIPLSKDEIYGLASDEIERRANESPEFEMTGLPAPGGGWEFTKPTFRVHAAVRVY